MIAIYLWYCQPLQGPGAQAPLPPWGFQSWVHHLAQGVVSGKLSANVWGGNGWKRTRQGGQERKKREKEGRREKERLRKKWREREWVWARERGWDRQTEGTICCCVLDVCSVWKMETKDHFHDKPCSKYYCWSPPGEVTTLWEVHWKIQLSVCNRGSRSCWDSWQTPSCLVLDIAALCPLLW